MRIDQMMEESRYLELIQKEKKLEKVSAHFKELKITQRQYWTAKDPAYWELCLRRDELFMEAEEVLDIIEGKE